MKRPLPRREPLDSVNLPPGPIELMMASVAVFSGGISLVIFVVTHWAS